MKISGSKFELGAIVATPAALDAADANHVSLHELIKRHARGDWGDISPADAQENEFSLANNFRLMSAYNLNSVKFWIITEADRSATTVLLPSDY